MLDKAEYAQVAQLHSESTQSTKTMLIELALPLSRTPLDEIF
jgi:hypothetical protein